MTASPPDFPDDDITRALAHDRLGIPAVVFFVMSAAAPLTVVAGLVTTGYAVTGMTGIPVAFLAIGLALALFSIGYVTMGRHLPHAGAFYAYISHGLSKPMGVGAAWVALLAYNGLQVALYGGIGSAASPLVKEVFGADLAWWVIALAVWALVAGLGLLRVDVNGTVLAVLLVAEIAVIVAYDLSYLSHPAAGLDLSMLSPSALFAPGAGALLSLAVLGFVGFESAVVFSEESRDPRRTVPLATYTSIAVIAGLYGLSSWAMAVAVGKDNIVGAAREQSIDLVFNLAATNMGGLAADIGGVLFITSLIAAMISFHNTIARYIFALGRERVLPSVFGGTSASGAPKAGSLTQSLVALVIIVGYAVAGLDPLVWLFYTLGTGGGFGALVLITWTSFAVFVFFRKQDRGESVLRTTVAPLAAIVVMLGILGLAVANFATMLGVDPSSPLRWGIPGAYLAVALLGTAYGFFLQARRPGVYASIGMGAKSGAVSRITINLDQASTAPAYEAAGPGTGSFGR